MEFQVLGPLQVEIDGQSRQVAAAIPRKLLGVLLVHLKQVVSADRLLEEVWADHQPKGGLKTLRYHISKLRDALDPERGPGDEGVVGTESGGYVLGVEPDQVDAGRFEVLAGEGAQLLADDRFEFARERLVEALGLWRGDALEDFRYDSFAQGEIARLEELRLLCLENRLAADLELGRHREVVAELRELTTEFPMREALWGQLMVALYRTDQQAEALEAYQVARKVLGEELGIEPNSALQRLEEQILLHELPFEAPAVPVVPSDNLPARVASFVGRAAELVEVEKLVGSHRLVTLTGFGGIGKTTLAIEVARNQVGSYPDGVWLVEFAALANPNYVVGEIAGVFGVSAHPTRPLLQVLVEELSSKSMLLVVDNCEHLVDESARVVDALLAGCADLRVLTTSRVPLRVSGEQTWRVPPFDLPEVDAEVTVGWAEELDAVRLFVDRAHESQPAFVLDESNLGDVVAICRRLEGIPLAFELAAARLRMLTPGQLLDRLEDRFALLTNGGRTRPERQETLEATLDWSYGLLSESAQTLLGRLAVFDGGFTLEAAETVCSGDGIDGEEVLDLLSHLLDASLLTTQPGEPARYGMLETVRQYAVELLELSGEEGSLRQRHADYYGGLVPVEPDFDTKEFAEAQQRLGMERDNFRAALAWSVEAEDGSRALRLAASVWFNWMVNSAAGEVLYWYPRVLELADSTPSHDRAVVVAALAELNHLLGRTQEGLDGLAELESIAEELDDIVITGHATNSRARHLEAAGDIKGSRQLVIEHVGRLRELDEHHPLLSYFLTLIGGHSVWLGKLEDAGQITAELEELARSLGQPMVLAFVAGIRGMIAHYRGDLNTARQLQLEALAEERRLERAAVQSEPLRELAQLSLAAGEVEEAEDWARQLVELAEHNGMPRDAGFGYVVLCRVALRRGEIPEAGDAVVAALDLASGSDDIHASAEAMTVAGQLAWACGSPQSAATLHGGAEALRARIGLVLPVHRTRELDREFSEIRSALGVEAFNTAWQAGGSLTLEGLVEEARRATGADPRLTN